MAVISRLGAVSIACLCLMVVITSIAQAEPPFESQVLFEKVRIPRLIVAQDGSVLAFADSCRVLRRSEDQGKTWSESVKVGNDATGNVVLDETTGDLLIVNGKGYLYRSQDHGKTWEREEISFNPNAEGYGVPDNVPVNLNCSESGITLQYGEHKGRLLMPVRLQPPHGDNAQEYWVYDYNSAIYSDDHGKTWQVSDPVQSGTGEGTLAELSDSRLYFNSRSHLSIDHRRQIAWSRDGGHRWTDWYVTEELREVGQPFYFKYGSKPSYGCNAGLVRMPLEATDGKDVLLYSTPDNPGSERLKMTVWASFDQTQTWPVKRMVYEGPSAYSTLAADKDGWIYLMYENGDKKLYERLTFVRFNLDWLAEGKDWHAMLMPDPTDATADPQ